MKKFVVFIGAILVLAACGEDATVVENVVKNNQEINVDFTISRSDAIEGTRATVKGGWTNDDVIFIVFNGVASPKYLELKYNLAGDKWVSKPNNGLVCSDLSESGTMTAIYLPYGSEYVVADNGTDFTIKDAAGSNYNGHFYVSEKVAYTFTESTSTLSGTVNLNAAAPESGDKLLHFDVEGGYDAAHSYAMYLDHMKPISLARIASDGTVVKTIGAMGDAIPGYVDANNSIVSFSGLLDESVVGNEADYWISVRDTEAGSLYYCYAGEQTISANMYVGLGSLNNWGTPKVGVFSVSDTKTVNIATSNLSYRGTETNKWQLMKYPWTCNEANANPANINSESEIGLFGWATSGYEVNPWYYSHDNQTYSLAGLASGESWPVGSLGNSWDWGVNNTVYEYGGETALTGTWRVLSRDEWAYLFGLQTSIEAYNYTVDGNDYTGDIVVAKNEDSGNTKRYGKYGRADISLDGTEAGIVHGVVLIPDAWKDPNVTTDKTTEPITLNTTFSGGADPTWYQYKKGVLSQSTNYYTMATWNKMEASGAIFLPAAGNVALVEVMEMVGEETIGTGMYNRQVQSVNGIVRYWTSTAANITPSDLSNPLPNTFLNGDRAYYLNVAANAVNASGSAEKSKGRSVRLVRDL